MNDTFESYLENLKRTMRAKRIKRVKIYLDEDKSQDKIIEVKVDLRK